MCRRPAPTPPRNLKRTSRLRSHILYTYPTPVPSQPLRTAAGAQHRSLSLSVCVYACKREDDLVNIRRGYTSNENTLPGHWFGSLSVSQKSAAVRLTSAALRAILSHYSHTHSNRSGAHTPAPRALYITFGVRAVRAVLHSRLGVCVCVAGLICGSRGWALPAAPVWCRAGWGTRPDAAAGR